MLKYYVLTNVCAIHIMGKVTSNERDCPGARSFALIVDNITYFFILTHNFHSESS